MEWELVHFEAERADRDNISKSLSALRSNKCRVFPLDDVEL